MFRYLTVKSSVFRSPTVLIISAGWYKTANRCSPLHRTIAKPYLSCQHQGETGRSHSSVRTAERYIAIKTSPAAAMVRSTLMN